MKSNLERIAEQVYNKWNKNLIGCCEPSWAETDESFKLRFIESIILERADKLWCLDYLY